MEGLGRPEVLAVAAGVYAAVSLTLAPTVARAQGRSALLWALVSLLVTPVLALLALAAMPDRVVRRRLRVIARRVAALERDGDGRRRPSSLTDRLLPRR